jgi:hypothetical protein
LHESVIASGAFDGDESVVELVLGKGLSDLCDGVVERLSVVFDEGGWEEELAVEIGAEEFGASFGTIEAEDAEVLGSDLLDAGMEHAAWLAEGGGPRRRGAFALTCRGHETCLR